MNALVHLAIIMDGNGRWAKMQGKARTYGHQQGINTLRNITIWCAKTTSPISHFMPFLQRIGVALKPKWIF